MKASYPVQMYQVYPRADLENVLSMRKDGGEHMPLNRAQEVAADRAGVSTAEIRSWWRWARSSTDRLYVAKRRKQAVSVVIAPAMPRFVDADGNPPLPGQLSIFDVL